MTIFLELKQKLKSLYAGYGTYLLPAGKFLLALAVFLSINRTIDAVPALGNVFLLLILSLICAIIPLNGMVFLGVVVLLIQCAGVHVLAAGFGAVLFLTLWILYLRFASGEALALLLTPLAFALNIPAAVPIAFGLAGGPMSALSVACGLLVYQFMRLVSDRISVLAAAQEVQVTEIIKALAEGIFENEDLLVGIICCTVALLVVYLIRSLAADYAWQISILAGAVAYVVIQLSGAFFLEVKVSVPVLLIGTAGACLICFLLEIFLFGGDYSRSKQFRFQDDEYYYYVKAVPKMAVTNPDRQIRMIGDEKESPAPVPKTEEMLRTYEISRKNPAEGEVTGDGWEKEQPLTAETGEIGKEIEGQKEEYSALAPDDRFPTQELLAEMDALQNKEELSGDDGQKAGTEPPANDEEKRKDDYFNSVDFEAKLTDTLKNL